MKSLFGLSVFVLFALCLSGCKSYTTPAASVANLTPTPVASETPIATETVPSLWGRYVYDLSHPLDLLGDGIAYYAAKPFGVARDAYAVAGNEIIFTGAECHHAAGVYRWLLDQGLLQLSEVNDPCHSRAGMLSNVLRRSPQQFPFAAIEWAKPVGLLATNQSAVYASGNLYVTDGSSGFYKYNPDGSAAASWPTVLSQTTGIAVDDRGDIFVANFNDATVHEFDPHGQPVRSWSVGAARTGRRRWQSTGRATCMLRCAGFMTITSRSIPRKAACWRAGQPRAMTTGRPAPASRRGRKGSRSTRAETCTLPIL